MSGPNYDRFRGLLDREECVKQSDGALHRELLRLWDEYTKLSLKDEEECLAILRLLGKLECKSIFGPSAEKGLAFLYQVQDPEHAYQILRSICDLQQTQSKELAQLCYDALKERYGHDLLFLEKIRIVGLRRKEHFTGAISHFELLNHLKKGNFIFHGGGLGTGEVMEVSFVREEATCEFEYVTGSRSVSFANLFLHVIPLRKDHFLAQRFGDPDALEEQAKQEPAEVIRQMISDLGDLTGTDIKEELCEYVIPKEEWPAWWSKARAELKKDPNIIFPKKGSQPFSLRQEDACRQKQFFKALVQEDDVTECIKQIYSFAQELPALLKGMKEDILFHVNRMLSEDNLSEVEQLSLHILTHQLFETDTKMIRPLIRGKDVFFQRTEALPFPSFQRTALKVYMQCEEHWVKDILELLPLFTGSYIREQILMTLLQEGHFDRLKPRIKHLIDESSLFPEFVAWYTMKAAQKENLPFGDSGSMVFTLQSFLHLLSIVERNSKNRELVRKMLVFLSKQRYSFPRKVFDLSSWDEAQEILVFCSKCHSLKPQDQSIMRSIAKVKHPTIQESILDREQEKELTESRENVLWGLKKTREKIVLRIQEINEQEIPKNIQEISVALSYGDLRENAEYKAAVENRKRLNSELARLNTQLANFRVMSARDIDPNQVGMGCIVHLESVGDGSEVTYTVLGSLESNPERNVISLRSQLAGELKGKMVGDVVLVKQEQYRIKLIRSIFEQGRTLEEVESSIA